MISDKNASKSDKNATKMSDKNVTKTSEMAKASSKKDEIDTKRSDAKKRLEESIEY